MGSERDRSPLSGQSPLRDRSPVKRDRSKRKIKKVAGDVYKYYHGIILAAILKNIKALDIPAKVSVIAGENCIYVNKRSVPMAKQDHVSAYIVRKVVGRMMSDGHIDSLYIEHGYKCVVATLHDHSNIKNIQVRNKVMILRKKLPNHPLTKECNYIADIIMHNMIAHYNDIPDNWKSKDIPLVYWINYSYDNITVVFDVRIPVSGYKRRLISEKLASHRQQLFANTIYALEYGIQFDEGKPLDGYNFYLQRSFYNEFTKLFLLGYQCSMEMDDEENHYINIGKTL